MNRSVKRRVYDQGVDRVQRQVWNRDQVSVQVFDQVWGRVDVQVQLSGQVLGQVYFQLKDDVNG